MTGIVIVVHAPLGSAMRESVAHVLGDATEALAVHDIHPEDLPDDAAPGYWRISCAWTRGRACWS